MDTPSKPADAGTPGHYGAGYGEQVPENPARREAPADTTRAPAGLEPIDRRLDPNSPVSRRDSAPSGADEGATTRAGPGDAPVVFTPDDVHARPPDRPPTEEAPASEKAGLIFERS